jgi:hypothetical protein
MESSGNLYANSVTHDGVRYAAGGGGGRPDCRGGGDLGGGQDLEAILSGWSMRAIDVGWAITSDAGSVLQDLLVPLGAETSWSELRFLWAPLWIGSNHEVRAVAERIAKAQFAATRDPMQCALLYLALEKQSALAAMFRAVKNEKIAAFMARDFTDPVNRQSAVKNACTLLSQHKYAQSAAFFLLADSPQDALDTLLYKLRDPMLALLITRLIAKADAGPVYLKGMRLVERELGDCMYIHVCIHTYV